ILTYIFVAALLLGAVHIVIIAGAVVITDRLRVIVDGNRLARLFVATLLPVARQLRFRMALLHITGQYIVIMVNLLLTADEVGGGGERPIAPFVIFVLLKQDGAFPMHIRDRYWLWPIGNPE